MTGKTFIIAVTAILFSACSGAPDGFCECLEKSEELNGVANQVLLGNDTEQKAKDLIQLREEQSALCKDFEETSGPDMIEWRKECE